MELSEAVEEYLAISKPKISPKTYRWYKDKLTVFVRWAENTGLGELKTIKAKHIAQFLEWIQVTIKNKKGLPISDYTAHGYAQVVKQFFRWCVGDEEMEEYVSPVVPQRIQMPRVTQKTMRILSVEEIDKLFHACENAPYPVRDKAILSLLIDTGMRLSELTSLSLDRLFLTGSPTFVRVLGKGKKERDIPIGRKSRRYLQAYLRQRQKKAEVVFLNRSGEPLTSSGVEQLLYDLCDAAGIERASAHKFRHTFAVSFLQNGLGDLHTLSRLLGHSETSTTDIYLRARTKEMILQKQDGISLLDSL